MGNEHGAEAQGELREGNAILGAEEIDNHPVVGGKFIPQAKHRHKQHAQGDSRDNIRIHHGDVVHIQQHGAGTPAHGVEAHRGEGSRSSGNHGSQGRHQQSGVDALDNGPVMEQLLIPAQGEALPHHVAVAGVEGKYNHQQDRGIQEQENQPHEDPAAQTAFFFHRTTACSSPSPKRFIIHMQMMTITIITSAMALPKWGL